MGFHIGIDLGTTNCCMAVYRPKKDPRGQKQPELMELLLNQGKDTTPSIITSRNGNTLVGTTAQRRSLRSPESTIFEAKRFIGRKFSDPDIQKNLRHNEGKPSHWPFKVESDGTSDDRPRLILSDGGTELNFSPEQVSAFILTHLKEVAEESLGDKVDAVTVTCPAYFNDGQRQATKDAAEMAGFDTVRILNEPTAAALAFKQEDDRAIGKTALVFDFGGGTLDVSIVEITDEDVTVLATGGDTFLGGADIDTILVDYCINEFREQTGCSEDISDRNMAELRKAVEDTKITLSSAEEEDVAVAHFAGQYLDVTITREDLERECHDFFLRCIGVVDAILSQSSISRDQIDLVFMTGGSSRIPKLVELMEERFPNKLRRTVQADHAIAMGASVAHLHVLNDVIPHDLGVAVLSTSQKGKMDMEVIIPRFSRIPITVTAECFSTSYDYQGSVSGEILEGDSSNASENMVLGEFHLTNLPLLPMNEIKIEVEMSVSSDGILEVKAFEQSQPSNPVEITVESLKGCLTREEKEIQRIEVNHMMRTTVVNT
ncbi:hypothetical protein GEMRC1_010309 [Eukaryota sp. GEM-RC1]